MLLLFYASALPLSGNTCGFLQFSFESYGCFFVFEGVKIYFDVNALRENFFGNLCVLGLDNIHIEVSW